MGDFKLEAVRPDVKKFIEPYLGKIVAIHKDNVLSVVLYGSATGEFYVPGKSDINLVIILKNLDFRVLKSSLKIVNRGINKKITAPLFMSVGHVETSKDAFPVEFLEIKENHILLYGQDIFAEISIKQNHLRLSCEREIKGKIIRLREAYLEVGLRKKGVEALMKESLTSLIPVFRALLRLKGQKPPVNKERALLNLSDSFGLDKTVFIAILKDKTNDEKISGQDIEIFFEKYLNEIEKLSAIVDTL